MRVQETLFQDKLPLHCSLRYTVLEEMRTGQADLLRPAGRTGLKRAEKPYKMKTNKRWKTKISVKIIQKYTFSERKFSKKFLGLRPRSLVLLIIFILTILTILTRFILKKIESNLIHLVFFNNVIKLYPNGPNGPGRSILINGPGRAEMGGILYKVYLNIFAYYSCSRKWHHASIGLLQHNE